MKSKLFFLLTFATIIQAIYAVNAIDRVQSRAAQQVSHDLQPAARNISRTPSMSRANTWKPLPANPGAASLSPQMQPKIISSSIRQSMQGRSAKTGIESQTHVNQFLNQRRRTSTSETRSGTQNLTRNLPAKIQERSNVGRRIRNDWKTQNGARWFGDSFWNNHRYYPSYWHQGVNYNGYSNWNTVNSWLNWGFNDPIYYEQDNWIALSPSVTTEYWDRENQYGVEQPQRLVNVDSIPLGVFALVNSGSANIQPSMYFQLLLKRDGTIEGSYFNQPTDKIYPIQGVIDQSSQKAVWQMSIGQNSPIFETGLYNLTLPETPVNVYFGDSDADTWLMINLQRA